MTPPYNRPRNTAAAGRKANRGEPLNERVAIVHGVPPSSCVNLVGAIAIEVLLPGPMCARRPPRAGVVRLRRGAVTGDAQAGQCARWERTERSRAIVKSSAR